MKIINPMTDRLKFAIISTITSFILGIIAYSVPMAAEHIYFFISAPIATFFTLLSCLELDI
jgi:hypothetical protein